MGEIVRWVVEVATLVAVAGLALLAKRYLPAYVKEKGKNLATKEDIGSITREIESAKMEYLKQLESVRAALRSRTHIHEVRYEREFDILLELNEKLVELRDSAMALRPAGDSYDLSEPEADRKKKRLSRYHNAAEAFLRFSEARRPFFPETIYAAVRDLDRAAWAEAVQYARRTPDAGPAFDPQYWDKAEANAEKIRALSEGAIEAIRDRVRLWEQFDPAPGPQKPAG